MHARDVYFLFMKFGGLPKGGGGGPDPKDTPLDPPLPSNDAVSYSRKVVVSVYIYTFVHTFN